MMREEHNNDGFVSRGPEWFCVRAKFKSEHIAAAALACLPDIQVFCPRIRERRATRRGPVWFMEALFPGYFFARFDPLLHLRTVTYANGSLGLIGFGGEYPPVPDEQIADLRHYFDENDTHHVPDPLEEGDHAVVRAGPLAGLEAVVARLLPAQQRVVILLDFLGSLRSVEIPRELLHGPTRIPDALLR